MIALDPNGTFPYVLRRQQGNPGAVTWRVRFLQQRELVLFAKTLQRLQEGAQDDEATELMDELLRVALRGWRGLKDEDGNDYPIPAPMLACVIGAELRVLPADAIARIPLTIADKGEIVSAAVQAAQLGVDDAKKSAPQPQ